MALQVWLPLNGDLRNQGVGKITSISTTPNYRENGKLFQLAIDLSKRVTFTCPNLKNLQDFSVAFWAYVDNVESLAGKQWVDLFGFTDTSSSGSNGTFRFETCYDASHSIAYYDNPTMALSNYTGRTYTTSKNIWIHCCVVFDNVKHKVYAYRNGIKFATDTHKGGKFNSNGTFYIGETNNIAGMIQDVRIYDHALSNKEVEEIAKGLILHYPLNNIVNPNLLKNIPRSVTPTQYRGYQLNLTEKLELNQTYILQLWDINLSHTGKTSSQLKLGIYLGGAYNELIEIKVPTGHLDYKKITFKKTSWSKESEAANLYLNIYNSPLSASGTKDMSIGNWKLEKGSIATPWCSFDSDTTIVYDSSGYGNNGTINGTLITTTLSPRYNYAINYPDSACAIGIGNLSTMVPEGIFTFNIWFKKNTGEWSSKTWETILGGPSGFELEGKIFSSTNAYIHPYSWGGGSTQTPNSYSIAYALDEWHMITMVRTTSNTKFYLDGEFKVTGSVGSIPSGDYFIGAWQTAAKQNYRGYLSDARIYTTALTDAQIKELYNTSMIVENDTIKPRNLE